MIMVLSKGTSEARIAAANLLFHYWPIHNRHTLHRKSIQYRIQGNRIKVEFDIKLWLKKKTNCSFTFIRERQLFLLDGMII